MHTAGHIPFQDVLIAATIKKLKGRPVPVCTTLVVVNPRIPIRVDMFMAEEYVNFPWAGCQRYRARFDNPFRKEQASGDIT